MAGSWNPAKVAAFRESFYEFAEVFPISSRDGARMMLGESLYRAQTMFYEEIFSGLAADCHEFYCLKSRQLGMSTGTRALSVFWLGIHPHLRGAMVFDSAFNTAAARREIEEALEDLPARLHFPKIKSRNRDVLILENDSWLMFMQAGTRNNRSGGGLGRSLGLNFVHCSEISSWANHEGVVSFKQSLSDSFPDRLYIWESTARGYELWHKLWTDAKADQISKRTLFIGWWAKDSQQITRDDPKFSAYGADPPNAKERDRIDAVRRLYDWQVTQEQLAWYRWRTDPARDLDDDEAEDSYVTAEQPWVEDDAFQMSGSSFFMPDKLSALASQLATDPQKPSYYRFWPGQDFVTCDCKKAINRRDIELRIWEEPMAHSVYIISADPAFGHDEDNDYSAAQVMRCYADGIDQVAEYASASIQPHQFAWLLWTLVGYYGSKAGTTVMDIGELNGPGAELYRQFNMTRTIVQQGYLRQAAQDLGIGNIFNNARHYLYSRVDSILISNNSAWWKTSVQNKVPLMESCRNYLHNGVFRPRSLDLLDEMRSISRNGDKIAADGDNRDDRTFAAALAIWAWDDRLRRGLIAGGRTREAERAKLSMSFTDQYQLFVQNHLDAFFKTKQNARQRQEWESQQRALHGAAGARRWTGQRRW